MTRVLMISDIHGCLAPLKELLSEMNYQPDADKLLLLGDYVDRGPCSRETVDYIMELMQCNRVIALKGNHDQRLVDWVRSVDGTVTDRFLAHGGLQTIHSYCKITSELSTEGFEQARQEIGRHYEHHLAFLDSLPLYYEDDQHIYVHAGLNPNYPNWRDQPAYDFMYIKEPFHRSPALRNKTVVFGHTRAVELHGSPDVWFGPGKIGIDGGCAYGLQLNGLIHEGGSYSTLCIQNSLQEEM
ncbi:metallophosphoesterase family protein [Paenibacillus daejeonensis]|uniref:metallophosphoesterase family protein n=1 Tax=Paenibacillus daejeonensis TaxID=135193 RepID=UPI00035DC8A0|nr:metallophosphoesterase family protein [Paenibacillus daejeonensis]